MIKSTYEPLPRAEGETILHRTASGSGSGSNLGRRSRYILFAAVTTFVITVFWVGSTGSFSDYAPWKSDKSTYVDDTGVQIVPPVSSTTASGSGSGSGSFGFCPSCSAGDSTCDSFSRSELLRSRAYAGSGRDIRRIIRKAQNGPTKMVIIGGSVSNCRGVDRDSECYHSILFNWWNSTFPHSDNELINLSRSATGSDYYSYCWPNHTPADVDVVVIELAVNDIELSPEITRHYEVLVRSLLQLPSRPAILLMSMFSHHLMDRWGFMDATEFYLPVANYYDVPLIAMKNVIYPKLLTSKDSDYFLKDGHHISAKGHKAAATFLQSYIQSEACKINTEQEEDQPRDIPLASLFTVPNKVSTFQEPSPVCAVAGDYVNPLKAIEGTGSDWEFYEWTADKRYMVTSKIGASISFKVDVHMGTIVVDYFRSKKYSLGNAECYVDDDESKAVLLEGYWDQRWNIGVPSEIAKGVSPGKHTVTCRVVENTANPDGGHHFRIIGVMSV